MKTISVGFFGIPNSGKSSLINKLSNKNICIVSDKPQTTQEVIDSVFIHKNIHISLIDTPGINYKSIGLRGIVNKIAMSALEKVNYKFFIIAADKPVLPEIPGIEFEGSFFVFTKIDKLDKPKLKTIAKAFFEKYKPKEIFFTSVKDEDRIEFFMDFIESLAQEDEEKELPSHATSMPIEDLFILKTKEQIFNIFEKEIPYFSLVKNVSIEETSTEIHIEQHIVVPRTAYRKIILGNLHIKTIREKAQWNIKKIVNKKVSLSLYVVINKDLDVSKDIYSRKVGSEDWL